MINVQLFGSQMEASQRTSVTFNLTPVMDNSLCLGIVFVDDCHETTAGSL